MTAGTVQPVGMTAPQAADAAPQATAAAPQETLQGAQAGSSSVTSSVSSSMSSSMTVTASGSELSSAGSEAAQALMLLILTLALLEALFGEGEEKDGGGVAAGLAAMMLVGSGTESFSFEMRASSSYSSTGEAIAPAAGPQIDVMA